MINEILTFPESEDSIILKVETTFNIPLIELQSRSRNRHLVEIRMMLIKLLKEKLRLSSVRIARILKRDHSTILYHISDFDNKLQFDKTLQQKWNTLTQQFINSAVKPRCL